MTSSFERVGRSRPITAIFFFGGRGSPRMYAYWDSLQSKESITSRGKTRSKALLLVFFINWLVKAPEVQFSRSHEVIVQTTAICNMYNCSFLQRKNWVLYKTPITSNSLLWRCSAKSRESFTPTDLQRNKYNIGWNKFATRHDQSEALPRSG